MKNNYLLKCLVITIFFYFFQTKNNEIQLKPKKEIDLTIIGSLSFSGSIARIPIFIMDLLGDTLKINYKKTLEYNLKETSQLVKRIVKNDNKKVGNVLLYTDILWLKNYNVCKNLPNAKIKIAYSMIESTAIPEQWVKLLNKEFDSVVVPDNFLVETYKNSGVRIPIFVLPLGLYLGDLLNQTQKNEANKPFVFGCSSVDWPRKNLSLLIKSFCKAFGNSKEVILKVHTKCRRTLFNLKNAMKKAQNVELIIDNLNWSNYIKLFQSFDCYVLISKGEGFSITPREALALGIPCIISNNTGHKTICQTNLVYSLKTEIEEPAYYEVFGRDCGKQFNCKMDDVINALKYVYENYKLYLNKAHQARFWVQQYLPTNLKNKYLNLIKPKKIILSSENKITDEYLMTDSPKLYEKYKNITYI